MKVLVIAALLAASVISIAATSTPSSEGRLVSEGVTTEPKRSTPERCRSARLAVVYYRNATWSWQMRR